MKRKNKTNKKKVKAIKQSAYNLFTRRSTEVSSVVLIYISTCMFMTKACLKFSDWSLYIIHTHTHRPNITVIEQADQIEGTLTNSFYPSFFRLSFFARMFVARTMLNPSSYQVHQTDKLNHTNILSTMSYNN